MTQLFIDEKQVVLPVDFKITINKENTAITERTDHTFEIEIPLSFPENRAMFMFIDRITSPLNDPTGKPARLMVDRKEVIAGKVILIGVEPDLLTIQIVTKNSLWNGIIDPEVMFEDFPMATPDKVTGDWPENKLSRGRVFADGSTCDMVLNVKYTGQQWMYVPTMSKNLVLQIDINTPDTMPVYEEGYGMAKQFFLKPFLVALFKSKGYTFSDGFFHEPYDRLFLPTNLDITDDMGMNLLLSGIKVVDFLADLEKLFDITFTISGSTVTAQPNAAISQNIHSLEVTDDYIMETQEVEEALFRYKFPSETQYKLHDTPTDISHWIDKTQTNRHLYMLGQKMQPFAPIKSRLFKSPQGPLLILPTVEDEDKISENQSNGNLMGNMAFFHLYNQYRGVKCPMLKTTYECGIVPAGMYCSSLEVEYDSPFHFLDQKLKYLFHTPCQRPIAPKVTHNPTPELIDEMLNGRKPRFKIDYVNIAFFVGWITARITVWPLRGNFPEAFNIKSVISITDYIDLLRMARDLTVRSEKEDFNPGQSLVSGDMAVAEAFLEPYKKYSLRLEGESGLKTSVNYDKVDYAHAYTFRFRSDVKINPSSKFLIHGQPYIMETCELTATAKGIDTFATGVFYKVVQ